MNPVQRDPCATLHRFHIFTFSKCMCYNNCKQSHAIQTIITFERFVSSFLKALISQEASTYNRYKQGNFNERKP